MKTLQAKLLSLFMGIALLPVMAMGLYSYNTAIKVSEENAGQTMVNSIEQMGKNLDYQIRNYKKYMDLIISSHEIRDSIYQSSFSRSDVDTLMVYNRLGGVLSGFFYHDDSVHTVAFYKGDERVYTYRGFQDGIRNFEKSSIYKKAMSMEGSIYIEGMLLENNDSGLKDYYYVFGRRFSDYTGGGFNGQTAGVFLFASEKIFSDIFKQMLYNGTGTVMICNGSGTIFSHTDKNFIGRNISGDAAYEQVFKEGNSGSYLTKINGSSIIVACYDLPQWDLKVVQTIPESEFTAGFGAIARSTLWLSIIMIVVVFIISFIVSRQLSGPVKTMVMAMKQVQNGNFDVRIENDFSQEFSIMASSFNYMTAKLKELVNRLVEEEKERGEIEFNMLQYQINPHFVNNTLGSIRLYALNEGAGKVADILSVLSRLFHRTLGRTGHYVSLSTELANLKDYIYIQQMLYNQKMTITRQVDDSILDCLIPNLLLQPLVENAIFHGLSKDIEKPELVIGGYREGQDVILFVKDNGAGIEEDKIIEIMEAGPVMKKRFNKIGVKNIDLRLKRNFGENYGVKLSSIPGAGTCAEVRLPVVVGGNVE